jgi:N-methylhydantoinase A
MRFVGQAFEIVVALPPGPYAAGAREGFLAAFEATYVEKFTRTPPSVPVEIVNIRASVSAQVPESGLGQAERRERATEPVKGTRPVYFPELGEARPTPVYDRYALRPGRRYDGPAVIEEAESTLVVGPGGRFEVSADNNVIVTLPGAES